MAEKTKQPDFTPGPWKVEFDTDFIVGLQAHVYGPDGDPAENAIAHAYGGSDDELRANARLIAKAPEMYDMLLAIWRGDREVKINTILAAIHP